MAGHRPALDNEPELTLEELVLVCSGANAWHTHPLPRVGLPAVKFTDGPNGARGRSTEGGPRSACFPVGTALAATWDVGLVEEVGRALGDETLDKSGHVLLAPTVNLHRSPLAGRNFECFSEDPELSARMAVAFIRGVQSRGVGCAVKHFVANESEYERYSTSSDVSERVLRELYLRPFEAAVVEAGVWAVMTAYNRLNGTWCSANAWLLGEVLKGEWGFEGLVISDWGGTYLTLEPALAGLDLEMPGPAHCWGERLEDAVRSGLVPQELLADKAARLRRLARRVRAAERPAAAPERESDRPEVRRLARRAAADSFVLLRNEPPSARVQPGEVRRPLLPLQLAPGSRVAVIGPLAERATIMGGGSSQVRPHEVSQPLDALRSRLAPLGIQVRHEPGCRIDRLAPRLTCPDGFEMEAWERMPDEHAPSAVALGKVDRIAVDLLPSDSPTWALHAPRLRWKGRFTPTVTGPHTFGLASAGLSRLWLDGELLVDNWTGWGAGHTFYGTGSTELRAGAHLVAERTYELTVDYGRRPGPLPSGVHVGVVEPDDPAAFDRAVGIARDADIAIVTVGLTAEWETEGSDRVSLELPGRQADLIEAVATTCANTVVVVNAGSPVRLDWADRVPAVLYAWYPGMEFGNALADVLLGDVNPSGRLPTTFPRRLEDTPSYFNYPGEAGHVNYGEGVFVGYRGFDARDVEPHFPFGFGLSYTTFAFGPLEVERGEGTVDVALEVTNTGSVRGAEVVQLYVADLQASVSRPPKELRAFTKVDLLPGQTKVARFRLDERAFAFWHPTERRWTVEPGRFDILVGPSSRHLPSRASVVIPG